ncbi:MBOAT family protein [Myxococcota bacterium]|nr:MBOAT family protein [Myxococcota bacterium]MBU1537215.1 MBOAT family protein [Myxococcota bacterium]
MLFHSLAFLIFFPTVVFLYFSAPQRLRWILLLGASYFFYMSWKPAYALLIFLTTVVSWGTALAMDKVKNRRRRKHLLFATLAVNLGVLFLFKYFNFFSHSLLPLGRSLNLFTSTPTLKLLLPIGISFYTFQSLSYTVDVYRQNRSPERHLGIFALYVSFFPQLVAGPIERSERLLPQFREVHHFDYQQVTDGLKLMAWGFFKKLVIADRLAVYVNMVYGDPAQFHGLPVILATYFFAFQIYCDFSAYSDIAIGAAQVMGFRLMENFRRPYFSASIGEFWRRWHISLTTWFRDYLYIPLGGNRVGAFRLYFNVMVVFLVSGMWHGANWTFLFWGLLHGTYFLLGRTTASWRQKLGEAIFRKRFYTLRALLNILLTFHLVVFAWIFFRARTIREGFMVVGNLFRFDTVASGWDKFALIKHFNRLDLVVVATAIFIMEVLQFFQERGSIRVWVSRQHFALRWGLYIGLLFFIEVFGVFYQSSDFIYFKF